MDTPRNTPEPSREMLTVVTVTYNSAAVLPEFIASAQQQSYGDFELLFVDNSSNDNTRAIITAINDPRFCLIHNEDNLGFSKGCNQGIRHAQHTGSPLVLLINNDTIFPPNLFAKLVNAANKYPVAVPKMLYANPSDRIWTAGGRFLRGNGFRSSHTGLNEIDRGQYDTPSNIDFAPMCCMLIKTEVFKQIGLLDEAIFAYCEDTDFCIRLGKADLPIRYIPDAVIHHKVSSLTGGIHSDFYVRNASFGKAYVLAKHGNLLERWLWANVYQAFYAFRWLKGHFTFKQLMTARKEHARGLKYKPSK